jgi:hypothetical protein
LVEKKQNSLTKNGFLDILFFRLKNADFAPFLGDEAIVQRQLNLSETQVRNESKEREICERGATYREGQEHAQGRQEMPGIMVVTVKLKVENPALKS